jgi:hypothetical protein
MTTKDIPLAGVIGDPVAHSLSPKLHGHWLSRYGLRGHYVPMRVAQSDLVQVLRTLAADGFQGRERHDPAQGTCPFARRFRHRPRGPDRGGEHADLHLAGRIQADNTDGSGFISNIRQSVPGWTAAQGPAVVLGSGGAAKAIVWALLNDGAPVVHVANRTRARADGLKDQFGAKGGSAGLDDDPGALARGRADREHDLPWHAGTATPVRGSLRCPADDGRHGYRLHAACARNSLRMQKNMGARRWTALACCCIRRFRGSSAGSAIRPPWTMICATRFCHDADDPGTDGIHRDGQIHHGGHVPGARCAGLGC